MAAKRHLVLLTLLTGSVLSGSQTATVVKGDWTLVETMERARAASPDSVAATARVEAVRAAEATIRSDSLPSVSIAGRYLQTTEPMSAFGAILNQGTFDDGIDFNDPGQIDAFTASLNGAYALYSGGRHKAANAAAEARSAAATYELEATLQTLELETARTWFSIREAESGVRSLKAALDALAETLRVSRLREEAGNLHATDRLNLEVEHARRRQELLAQEHAVAIGRRQLAFLLGLPTETPLTLAEGVGLPEDSLSGADASLANHPRLRAMEARLRGAEANLRHARGARLPTVEAFARYQFDKGWRRDGEGDSWTAGVALQLPVFDGFSARSQRRSALAQQRAETVLLQRTEAELEMELANAYSRHALAEAEVSVAGEREAQARASAELSRERYGAGTLSSTDLIEAEARLIAAEVALSRAHFAEQFARAALRHAMGRPLTSTSVTH